MHESLRRQREPERLHDVRSRGGKGLAPLNREGTGAPLQVSRLAFALAVALILPAAAFAQSPWERAARNLELTFTGPLARSLALVALVIGGLMFMFGEAGAKRQISGIVFGGGLALFAAQFLTWLF